VYVYAIEGVLKPFLKTFKTQNPHQKAQISADEQKLTPSF
jgi:hypothetical protein